jgi:serine protease
MTLLSAILSPAGRIRIAVAVAWSLAALLPSLPASGQVRPAIAPGSDGQKVSRIQLRIASQVRPAAGTQLGGTPVADLERALGRPIVAVTTNAAGNQVLELAAPVDLGTARQLVDALRLRADVVWAEIERGRGASAPAAKSAAAGQGGLPTVRRLLVTLADPLLADASRVNAKLGTEYDAALSAAAGAPLRVARAIAGGAWLVELATAVDTATAESLAARLEESGVARFAAPDYLVRTAAVPNDPIFAKGNQWNLQERATTGYYGIDATHAWNITMGSAGMVIAVVDTGIVAHPDLAGRILGGYDFVSSVTSANDGDGRDADATDPGDWRTAGLCPAPMDTAEDSSWHGTLVSGVLAANANNGIGIAGVDWNARIVPVRALGRCGGTISDILDGMTWAAGLPVPGIPVNSHPARVINMSVGGKGACSSQIQALVDAVLDAGVFVAVAAGNGNANADGYVPASCGGLSTVAATDWYGARASYSNFSSYLDIAAPGGDYNRYGLPGSIVSTWNDGKTVAGAPIYADVDGTSFSTPHVAGVAALMLAVNPALTPAQIKALMAKTASPFAPASDCATQGICGAGILDAYASVQAAQLAVTQPPPTDVVEFYNAARDHYFISAAVPEIRDLDTGVHPGWQRTGYVFGGYAAATAGFNPVCRFYIPPPYGDSHFFSASKDECAQTQAKFPFFTYEAPNVFYIGLPDANGTCGAGTIPVYRVWDSRADTNHRYMTSKDVRAQMIAKGWVAEGYGPDQVIMCAPI